MAAVSYNAIYTMQENKIKTAISFDLSQQSIKLTQIYNYLLQITQQMAPEGNVGSLTDEYLSESSQYNRYVLARDISTNMGLIGFSNPNVELMMYYNPDSRQIICANLPVREDFFQSNFPVLSGNSIFTYQPPHLSQCRFNADQVVSVTRQVTFLNGQKWFIYVEAKSEIAADISILSKGENMPYVLVLTDQNGKVIYSSNKVFSYGQSLRLNGNFGETNGYVWSYNNSDYGYGLALLVPVRNYNHELYAWTSHMIVILGVLMIAMGLIAVMLLHLIYKLLYIFEYEINSLGKGQLDAMKHNTGLDEFDRLFEQFNDMKHQIQQLIMDREQKEKKRHQTEMEMLNYQINPHFLMNTLDSVHWLAVMHKQPDIDKVISTLNFLLSYNLGKSQEPVTLRTEIKVLSAYIDLQKMRYDFEVVMNIEEGDYLNCHVARFILQPIAENSICHGLDDHGTLRVDISPDREKRIIIIIIQDNGRGLSPEALAILQNEDDSSSEGGSINRGIGLRYVRSVLRSFYGDNAHMSIESELKKGTAVTLYLPYDGRE